MKKYILGSIFLILIVLIVYFTFFFDFFEPTYEDFDYELTNATSEAQFEVVAENLNIPWGIVFIDEGILVTERTGRVKLITDEETVTVLDLTEEIVARGESGLLSMVKHPEFETNNRIYLYHSYNNNQDELKLKIVSYEYKNNILENPKTIIDEIPGGFAHSSGEMIFGPDEKLYISTGDAADDVLSQQGNSLAGKTLRLNDNGTIPNDNPFLDDDEIRDEIWTLGHRNAQGIDFHPETGKMYQSEHGPSVFDGGTGKDEINLVEPGKNYGWPTIRGMETAEGLETPPIEFSPAIAPGSIAFYDGKMFPELQNKLLVAALRGQSIFILDVDGNEIKVDGKLVDDSYGRIREIQVGEDGSIYFTTSNMDGRGEPRDGDDKIVRIYK